MADEGLACAAVVFGGVTTGVVFGGTAGVDGATVVVCCEDLACKSLALH